MLSTSPLRRAARWALPALTVIALGACDESPDIARPAEEVTGTQTILGIARNTDAVSTLSTAIGAAGLDGVLVGDGPFTVFAPVDEAFDGLPAGTLDALLESGNADVLAEVLTYHVVPGRFTAADLTGGQTLATAEGRSVTISTSNGVQVNGATVLTADIEASNGVIHLIDGVLTEGMDIADVARTTGETRTLAAAVAAGGLVETLESDGPFTVFAPINSAFDAIDAGELLDPENIDLLQKVLTYHVIPGEVRAADLVDGQMAGTVEGSMLTIDLDGGPKVNGANIIATDIETANGVIHLVDAVLLEHLDVVERAIATPQTETLAAAVGAAGLVETLQGPGPFTVFAPINEAFEALDTGDLLDPANLALLQKVLTYHVIPGEVRAADLVNGQMARTVEGSMVEIDLTTGPKVNGANIIATDIEVGNGVIHLIDGVLTENLDIVERAIVTPQTETLTAAVVAGELAGVLGGDTPFTVFAPINEAFALTDTGDLLDPANLALLQKVLTYHVVPGEVRAADLVDGAQVATVEGSTVTIDLSEGAKVNGANIIATDIEVANGVIHLIDGVIFENLNIVERAIVTPATETLQAAVIAADLAGTLSSDGPFTVFAPTNEAFAALPEGTLESLLLPENIGQLQSILTYHVLAGEVRAADLVDGATPATVQGSTATIDLSDGPKVNDANIIITDIETSNGVIHVIDAVILPPSE